MGSSQILRAFFRTYVPHGSSMIARATFAQSSAYAGNVTDVANMMSDRTTPGQRTPERDFVGIFKVAADGYTVGKACYLNAERLYHAG